MSSPRAAFKCRAAIYRLDLESSIPVIHSANICARSASVSSGAQSVCLQKCLSVSRSLIEKCQSVSCAGGFCEQGCLSVGVDGVCGILWV